MRSLTTVSCLLSLMAFLTPSSIWYIFYIENQETQYLKVYRTHIQDIIQNRKEQFLNTITQDFIEESKIDLEFEVETKSIQDYFEPLRDSVYKRYSVEMIYILYRDLKWKIVRDLREVLKEHVRLFIKDNPKYLLKKKVLPTVVKILKTTNQNVKSPEYIIADVNNICQSNTTMKHHNKVLSFCVYGKRQIYYDGIEVVLKNARNISLYKDWQIRIYHDEAISDEKIQYFSKKDDNIVFCDARKLPRYGNLQSILGKFWRVAPISDPSVDVSCSRDLDSKIITREEDAVKEWLNSSRVLHTMRDHRQHEVGMMAGMWCWNNQINRTLGRTYFERLIQKAKTYTLKTDQPLLNQVIWDDISKHHLYDWVVQHDSYNCQTYKGSQPFPTKRKNDNEFIGCPVHECAENMKPCPENCRPSYGKTWKYC